VYYLELIATATWDIKR